MWKQTAGVSVLLFLAIFLFPLGIVEPLAEETEQETGTPAETLCYPGTDAQTSLTVEMDGVLTEMTLGDYLTGVVRAEMPADFETEALKAQAVAARTYTLYQLAHADKAKHGSGAALCTDSGCCQAYISEERARKNWGDAAEEKCRRTAEAVTATDGVAALYEGEPILAAFHSSAAGATEDAAAAWSASVPYLQSVQSPETAETVPHFGEEKRIAAEEFRRLFSEAHPEAAFEGDPSGYIRDIQRDGAGYVSQCTVGGVTVRGVEVRRLFSLRSACFTVQAEGGEMVFRTEGYGHGVGLSQYGAELMAQEGADFREILTHYYSGITLACYRSKSS